MNCCVVKRKPSFGAFFPIVTIFVLCIIAALVISGYGYMPASLFVFVLGVVICAIMLPGALKSEYEYNIEGDTFSVAIIKNKASRKELFSSDIAFLSSCVPLEEKPSHISFKKSLVATGGNGKRYFATFTREEETVAITFSPDEEFMKSLRLLAPLKVKINTI